MCIALSMKEMDPLNKKWFGRVGDVPNKKMLGYEDKVHTIYLGTYQGLSDQNLAKLAWIQIKQTIFYVVSF